MAAAIRKVAVKLDAAAVVKTLLPQAGHRDCQKCFDFYSYLLSVPA